MTPELVYYYPEGHEYHFSSGHVEKPERIETIRRALEAAGWWDPYPRLPSIELPADVLQTIHTPAYLNRVRTASRFAEHLDLDTYTTPYSWEIALQTAGGAAAVASAVWSGEARYGFALTRPPGHHATPHRAMGFCLLNNIALAAEWLFQQHNARRLAIVDLDLHHGNGTQEIFWRRDDVFFLSVHQSPLFPGTGEIRERGAGLGEGLTANFPLPPDSGDQALLSIVNRLILPLMDRYSPEMLLVSIGFDVHWRDPLGHLRMTAAAVGQAAASLQGWANANCQGRLAFFLEGGYDLDATAACAQALVACLLGKPWQDPVGEPPTPEGTAWEAMLQNALNVWNL